MPVDIFPTTAENVIAATDAVLTRELECDEAYVARFMDVPPANAHNALEMAKELGLVKLTSTSNYCPQNPFAIYLVTSRETQKAAVLRLVLENYPPYQTFKFRLAVTGLAATAADQVRVMYNLTRHRDEIKDTFISLGTFAQSLVSEGAGLFRSADSNTQRADHLEVLAEVAASRTFAEATIRGRLGDEVTEWINHQEVFSPLVTAYQQLSPGGDHRSPIVYAGNAIESFLIQLGTYHGVSLTGATGINSKATKFSASQLNAKHKSMVMYLGHIRNATDHGVDSEIGASWDISRETAVEYVHVAMSTVKSIVSATVSHRYVL
jgi:hypothetical protein